MSVLDIPIQDEFLSPEELREMTGCHHSKDQIKWLSDNGWSYSITRSGRPIVSRWAMRLRLAGLPTQNNQTIKAMPDFSKAR